MSPLPAAVLSWLLAPPVSVLLAHPWLTHRFYLSLQVVEGVYCGRRVAVKQIYTGILMQQGTQQLRQQLLTQQQSQQAQQAQQAQEAREAQQQHLQDVQDSLIAALEQEVQVLARCVHGRHGGGLDKSSRQAGMAGRQARACAARTQHV